MTQDHLRTTVDKWKQYYESVAAGSVKFSVEIDYLIEFIVSHLPNSGDTKDLTT